MVTARSAGRPFSARIDGVGVTTGESLGVIAVRAAALAKFLITQVGKGDVVELQVFAARRAERHQRLTIGCGGVSPENIDIGIDLGGHALPPRPHMQHRRRGNRLLRRTLRDRLQKLEIIDHDRARIIELSDYGRNRRLLFGADKLRAGHLFDFDALQLAQEVDVPVVAAEFAVGHRLQADRLLARDGGANRLVLVLAQPPGVDFTALEAGACIDEGLRGVAGCRPGRLGKGDGSR